MIVYFLREQNLRTLYALIQSLELHNMLLFITYYNKIQSILYCRLLNYYNVYCVSRNSTVQ